MPFVFPDLMTSLVGSVAAVLQQSGVTTQKPKDKPEPSGHPKHQVIISLYSRDDGWARWGKPVEALKADMAPNAYVYDMEEYTRLPATNTEDCFKTILREHVKKHGKIDELILAGHGYPHEIGSGVGMFSDSIPVRNSFYVPRVLHVLEEMTKEANPTAKNPCEMLGSLVVHGCMVAENEDSKDIAFFRERAKILGIRIVMPVSVVFSFMGGSAGEFAAFTPEGGVERDARWTDHFWGIIPMSAVHQLWLGREVGNGWLQSHAGKTQVEGEAAEMLRKNTPTFWESYQQAAQKGTVRLGGF